MSKPAEHEYMTAKDARQLLVERRQPRHQALHEIILLMEKMITHASTHEKDDLLIQIPVFQSHLPPFERKELVGRLVRHFRRTGFFVVAIPDRRLYISWKPKPLTNE